MKRISVHSLLKILLPLLLMFGSKQCYADTVSIPFHYYHSDHLGSASWITNGSGTPVQHLQYMPYGEPFVNERSSSYNERFTFTGKERDSETGYSYFGARFYDSDLMTGWLSVDPMADSIPYASPYIYCLDNPIKLKDPNGEIPLETIWDIGNVLYDFGAAVTNHIKGDHEAAKSNWCDLALDAAATLTPYVPAGVTKIASTTKKMVKPTFSVKPGKYDYFFGKVTSSQKNMKRSLQNKNDLSYMGISNEEQLNTALGKALDKGKETKRITNEYGITICKQIDIGDKGSIEVSFLYRNGDMSSTPEVTTLIPRINKQ